MGKFFAALIMVFMLAWLGPMCARLPDSPATVAVLAATQAPAPAAAPPAPARARRVA